MDPQGPIQIVFTLLLLHPKMKDLVFLTLLYRHLVVQCHHYVRHPVRKKHSRLASLIPPAPFSHHLNERLIQQSTSSTPPMQHTASQEVLPVSRDSSLWGEMGVHRLLPPELWSHREIMGTSVPQRVPHLCVVGHQWKAVLQRIPGRKRTVVLVGLCCRVKRLRTSGMMTCRGFWMSVRQH